ncbi:MAG TPA: small ribosomal subunit Rsm22 family protein [Rhizobiaceae bacterium]|nr:small ribosomal subunit Rsm22 family protein [Rhizobiaceae bacterium]
MELPARLRQGVDAILDGVPVADLRGAARILSDRYRGEVRDGRLHMNNDLSVRAYLAARLPATYAAVRASFDAIAEAEPEFAPASLLDIGAGPGTVAWAAKEQWPDLGQTVMVEASDAARRIGERLWADNTASARWQNGDASSSLSDAEPADLVTIAYVLDELSPTTVPGLIDRLWSLAQVMLIIVEPGTPAGWRRILAVRERLIAAGAHVIAPCPHNLPCPLAPPDWCHFSRRVARSRVHRLVKDADVPWEDEKFIYLAASRHPPVRGWSRVLAPPRASSGKIQLKLCAPNGAKDEPTVTKRDGAAYKIARRAGWGDAVEIA